LFSNTMPLAAENPLMAMESDGSKTFSCGGSHSDRVHPRVVLRSIEGEDKPWSEEAPEVSEGSQVQECHTLVSAINFKSDWKKFR
jgi:hypothetical protein